MGMENYQFDLKYTKRKSIILTKVRALTDLYHKNILK